jgi:flagellin
MAAGSILNNISAISASRNLGITGMGMDKTLQRLTTGKRINFAADDAAGLAISNRLGADIRISIQARRNALDGVALLQVGDGILEEVTSLLTRASELTEQARTGTISSANREAIDIEWGKISSAIADLGAKTKFNGQSVFVNDPKYVSLADFTWQNFTVGTMVNNMSYAAGRGTATSRNLLTASSATIMRAALVESLQSVSMQRASIGANMQNLWSYANTLGIQVENFTAAFSQIRDANIADEVINLTKFQILNQTGTSALGQSNQAAQSVIALLR